MREAREDDNGATGDLEFLFELLQTSERLALGAGEQWSSRARRSSIRRAHTRYKPRDGGLSGRRAGADGDPVLLLWYKIPRIVMRTGASTLRGVREGHILKVYHKSLFPSRCCIRH